MTTQFSEILQLSVAERIQLVEDIWDSVAAFPNEAPLTESQKKELDRRLLSYAQNPQEGIPWEDLKAQLSQL